MEQASYQIRRQEWKYPITQAQRTALVRELAILLSPDPMARASVYPVRSLYFDTPEGLDLAEKLAGVRRRKKLRLRIYDPAADVVKLECKEKDGAYQQKTSLSLTRAEAERLMRGDGAFLLARGETAIRFYLLLTEGLYRPQTIVEYRRRAFVYPDFHTRLTLDEQVRGGRYIPGHFFDETLPLAPAADDLVTLEVKFDGVLAPAIAQILSRHGLTRASVSKYAGVCEAL